MPPTSHPLDGCRAKMERGAEHLAALKTEMDAHWERKPYKIVDDFESVPGYLVRRLESREPPPLRWSLLIGDAVHNMRCVLDYLTCELVLLNHGTATRDTAFPILDAL